MDTIQMRILYAVHQFFPEYIAGTERFTLNLSSAIQQAGHQVRVATYSCGQDAGFYQRGNLAIKDYVYHGIPVTAFKHKNLRKVLSLRSFNFLLKQAVNFKRNDLGEFKSQKNITDKLKNKLREVNICLGNDKDVYIFAQELLEKESFDLLHVTHPMRMTPLMFAAKEKKVPYVLTLTDFYIVCHRIVLLNTNNKICFGPEGGQKCLEQCPLLMWGNNYFLERKAHAQEILSGAAQVVAPSNFVKNLVLQEFPGTTIKVIPHDVNFKPVSRNNKFYYPDSAITFGFMGVLGPYKGVHVLIEAFKGLEDTNCRLKIHGAPYSRQYEEKLKIMAGGDKRIEFKGAYTLEKDAANILNNIDVLCVPSLSHESFGLVIQEALAGGVPVVGARRGGIPENIKDGVNGFIFEPSKVDELRQIMEKIIKDPTILNAFKKEIIPPPELKREAQEYEQIYRRAVGNFLNQKETAKIF